MVSEGDCSVDEGGGAADAGMIISDNADGAANVSKAQ